MKRVLFLLTAAIFLFSVGCYGAVDTEVAQSEKAPPSPTAVDITPESAAEADDEFYFCDYSCLSSGLGIQQLYETDTTIYYLLQEGGLNYKVYFSDKEYKDWMPLCFKPDCNHRNANCNACLEEGANAKMLLYGKHIYYIVLDKEKLAYVSIYRMKLDGSDHECIYTMQQPNIETVKYATKSWSWSFFNKYAMVSFAGSRTSDGGDHDSLETEAYSYLIDLSKQPPEPELYEGFYDDSGELFFSFGLMLAGDGDVLYSYNPDDNHSVYKFDFAAKKAVRLCEVPLTIEMPSGWLDGSKLYLSSGNKQGIIICVNTDDGSYEILNEAEPKTYRWYYPYRNYIFGANGSNNEKLKGTAIYDINGALVAEIPYSSYNVDIVIHYIIGDYILGADHGLDENQLENLPTWYLDMRDIGTDNLMWRKWAP